MYGALLAACSVLELRGRAIKFSSEQPVKCGTPSDVPVTVHHISYDRGVSWDEANRLLREAGSEDVGAAAAGGGDGDAEGTGFRWTQRKKMFGERDGLYVRTWGGAHIKSVAVAIEKGDASVRGLSEASDVFRFCAFAAWDLASALVLQLRRAQTDRSTRRR